jgi:hypothetical protein
MQQQISLIMVNQLASLFMSFRPLLGVLGARVTIEPPKNVEKCGQNNMFDLVDDCLSLGEGDISIQPVVGYFEPSLKPCTSRLLATSHRPARCDGPWPLHAGVFQHQNGGGKAEPGRTTAAALKTWQRRGTPRWVGSALEMAMVGDCDGTWGERLCCKHVLVSCFTCVWLWLAMVGWAAGKLSSVGAELLHILGIERQLMK